MTKNTGIEWTDDSFNPWWGCHEVSAGCDHCYARARAERDGRHVWGPPATTRRVIASDATWREPEAWNRAAMKAGTPRRVLCLSMGDVCEVHPDLDAPRARLWPLIAKTPWLDWLLLTKRPEQFGRMLPAAWLAEPRPNVWLGTSVEDQAAADLRIPRLLSVPAAVHYLSCEPVIGLTDLRPWLGTSGRSVGWVIVGGESGPRYRPMRLEWARSLRDQCQAAGVPFFYKQGAGMRHGLNPDLDGRRWQDWPTSPPHPARWTPLALDI